MTQIVWTQGRCKFCCLAELGKDLTDAPFVQGPALAEKERPIRPGTPGSHCFSSFHRPFSPVFCQAFAVGEIGIERFACFLDERDLAMFESLATANDEQPAPCRDLDIGNLERSHFRDAGACIAEEGSESQRQSVIAANALLCAAPYRVP